MAHKTLVNGTAYEITGGRTLVDGTGYSVKNGKTLVGGTAYEIAFRRPLGEYAIGSTVRLNVNGVRTEFLVVHQGLPSSEYDGSCNGTWLLTKDAYEKHKWNNDSYDVANYATSEIHSYMNSTFVDLFDPDVKSAIKTVKIPYMHGSGTSSSLSSGANGLSTRVFLLSYDEVGMDGASSDKTHGKEGSPLDYFKDADNSVRKCYFEGSTIDWWLRSPHKRTGGGTGWDYVFKVKSAGYVDYSWSDQATTGMRPAIIMPSDFVI